ncbi:nicotinate (nicotinamide) nucleotide adenylyltransferase [Hydrogenophaga crassostreae]|nr:nicotinate (nicotinamide) nucleotide adenylyltransferase [Hydrogenophaga crassostreae]
MDAQSMGVAAEPCALVVRRVGMFGGAFDPPHLAHRELAEVALAQLGLDVLHILPTGQAWHKARPLSGAEHRLAMCELVFGDLEKACVDARETLRVGPSYTADTLIELAKEYPGAELFMVIGADQLLAFKSWVRWEEVMDLATLAVAQRPPQGPDAALEQGLAADISHVDVPFVPLNMPLHHISATAIRARASAANGHGPDLDRLVSNDVASYISTHSLYQDPT